MAIAKHDTGARPDADPAERPGRPLLTSRPAADVVGVERRNQGAQTADHVGCIKCSAAVLLDTTRIRLRPTRGEIACPNCGTVIWVRRMDAFRDDGHSLGPWAFVATPAPDAKRRPRRWWRA